jgi:hypothetical protein
MRVDHVDIGKCVTPIERFLLYARLLPAWLVFINSLASGLIIPHAEVIFRGPGWDDAYLMLAGLSFLLLVYTVSFGPHLRPMTQVLSVLQMYISVLFGLAIVWRGPVFYGLPDLVVVYPVVLVGYVLVPSIIFYKLIASHWTLHSERASARHTVASAIKHYRAPGLIYFAPLSRSVPGILYLLTGSAGCYLSFAMLSASFLVVFPLAIGLAVRGAFLASIAALVLVSASPVWVLLLRNSWRLVRMGRTRIRAQADSVVKGSLGFVLLLRPFHSDNIFVKERRFFDILIKSHSRLEEAIVSEAAKGTAVVTVGVPNEAQPKLGSYRIYFGDSTWMSEVTNLIKRAEPIFILLEESGWVAWELQKCVELGAQRKTFVLLKPQADVDVLRLLENAGYCSKEALNSAKRIAGGRSILGLMLVTDALIVFTGEKSDRLEYSLLVRMMITLWQSEKNGHAYDKDTNRN